MIVDSYNRILFERDDGHFHEALALIRPTLAKLKSLKQAGKLDGQPIYGTQFIDELTDELAYCDAAPRALTDLEFARSRSPALACRLLELRARSSAAKRDQPGLFANANAVSALPFGDSKQLARLAIACAACAEGLGALPQQQASKAESESLRGRCVDRGVAALDLAIDQGFKNNVLLETDKSLEPLRKHPDFPALIKRLYHPARNAER